MEPWGDARRNEHISSVTNGDHLEFVDIINTEHFVVSTQIL